VRAACLLPAVTAWRGPVAAASGEADHNLHIAAAIEVRDALRLRAERRNRSTTVWQTRVTRGDGKLAAVVTQIQLVMQKKG
jgi:hypothetical protein